MLCMAKQEYRIEANVALIQEMLVLGDFCCNDRRIQLEVLRKQLSEALGKVHFDYQLASLKQLAKQIILHKISKALDCPLLKSKASQFMCTQAFRKNVLSTSCLNGFGTLSMRRLVQCLHECNTVHTLTKMLHEVFILCIYHLRQSKLYDLIKKNTSFYITFKTILAKIHTQPHNRPPPDTGYYMFLVVSDTRELPPTHSEVTQKEVIGVDGDERANTVLNSYTYNNQLQYHMKCQVVFESEALTMFD